MHNARLHAPTLTDVASRLSPRSNFVVYYNRGLDGDRVVRDLGARVSRVAARRRQALVAARGAATGSQEDLDSAEFELGLWSEWDALTGPAQ